MSSFKGMDLFGSGPHRFTIGPSAQFVISDFALGLFEPTSSYLGLIEREISITGRLVATDEASLDVLRNAAEAGILDPPTPGVLIDGHGRSWSDMSFVRFEPGSVIDRGRTVSLTYEARFVRFTNYPQGAP